MQTGGMVREKGRGGMARERGSRGDAEGRDGEREGEGRGGEGRGDQLKGREVNYYMNVACFIMHYLLLLSTCHITHACTHTPIYIHLHTHTQMHMHTHTHIHTHSHTQRLNERMHISGSHIHFLPPAPPTNTSV